MPFVVYLVRFHLLKCVIHFKICHPLLLCDLLQKQFIVSSELGPWIVGIPDCLNTTRLPVRLAAVTVCWFMFSCWHIGLSCELWSFRNSRLTLWFQICVTTWSRFQLLECSNPFPVGWHLNDITDKRRCFILDYSVYSQQYRLRTASLWGFYRIVRTPGPEMICWMCWGVKLLN